MIQKDVKPLIITQWIQRLKQAYILDSTASLQLEIDTFIERCSCVTIYFGVKLREIGYSKNYDIIME